MDKDYKIIEIIIDEKTIARGDVDIEHERAVAIFDIVEQNFFQPLDCKTKDREFILRLGMAQQKLVLTIESSLASNFCIHHILSLSPFRQIIKDYFLICENYYNAIKREAPSKIETIDMARRGLHDEGAKILQARLQEKIKMDFDTARRLFTLICMLKRRVL